MLMPRLQQSRERNENLPYVEMLLGVVGAQEPQCIGLRLVGDHSGQIDDSSSVQPRNDGSTFTEQVGKQYSLNVSPTSVTGSEAGYDPLSPRWQITPL